MWVKCLGAEEMHQPRPGETVAVQPQLGSNRSWRHSCLRLFSFSCWANWICVRTIVAPSVIPPSWHTVKPCQGWSGYLLCSRWRVCHILCMTASSALPGAVSMGVSTRQLWASFPVQAGRLTLTALELACKPSTVDVVAWTAAQTLKPTPLPGSELRIAWVAAEQQHPAC